MATMTAELISPISSMFNRFLTLKHYDKEVTQIRKMAGVKRFQPCRSTLEEKVESFLKTFDL
jgi:hypothetical protein